MTLLETVLTQIMGCFHSIPLSYGLISGLFVVGLAGSIGHCTLMCGPFVMSQAGKFEKASGALLIPYHLGRITTYMFIAAVFYGVVSMTAVLVPLKVFIVAPLLTMSGLLFLLSAFPKLMVAFPWAGYLSRSVQAFMPQGFLQSQGEKPQMVKLYAYGVMLGFIPCGMVFAAVMAAATADSFTHGMLAMFAFGLGTIPALMLVALGAGKVGRLSPKTARVMKQTAYTWTGLWFLLMSGKMILSLA